MLNLRNCIKDKNYFMLYIYLFIFLMPWNFFKWQMGTLTIILFVWWIIKYNFIILNKLKLIINFKPILLLIIFILYTYLSTLWSSSIQDGLDHVNKFHKYYFLIILPLFLSLKYNEALFSIKILLISIGSYAIFSLLIYMNFFTIELTKSDSSNPKGIMAYAIMSVFMAVAVVLSFFMAKITKNNSSKIIFYLISLLSFITLFVNNSRTAQLSLLLTIIIVSVFYFKDKLFKLKNIVILTTMLLLITFSSYQLLKDSNSMERYRIAYNETLEIVEKNHYQGSFGVRVYFNIAGFNMFKEKPIFGYGPESNIKRFVEYQENDPLYTEKIYKSFHSQHIDLLTRYGLVGYLFILISAIYLIYTLHKFKNLYYMAMSFFLVVFFSSLANVMLIKKPFNYIYITVFVLLSVISYYKNNNKEIDYV
jgi:O-antigen ligase